MTEATRATQLHARGWLRNMGRLLLHLSATCGVCYLFVLACEIGPVWYRTILKCAVVWLLAARAALSTPMEHDAKFAHLISAGLMVCSLGDAFLEAAPREGFLYGLISFLMGHIVYIVAFVDQLFKRAPHQSSFSSLAAKQPKRAAAIILYGVGYFRFLLASIPAQLLGAVAFYTVVISGMLLSASALEAAGHPSGRIAAMGALVFVVSDSILAANKFVAPLPMAKYLIMVTYYSGQGLIALSVGSDGSIVAAKDR